MNAPDSTSPPAQVLAKNLRALQQAAQARALLNGREYVLPDDVKSLAAAVLAHRLVTDASARLRGATGESVIAAILDAVPVPIEV